MYIEYFTGLRHPLLTIRGCLFVAENLNTRSWLLFGLQKPTLVPLIFLDAIQVIECHLEGLLESYAFGQISGRAKRINIAMPERALCLIDLYAKKYAQKNRSSLLADTALSYMESHK